MAARLPLRSATMCRFAPLLRPSALRLSSLLRPSLTTPLLRTNTTFTRLPPDTVNAPPSSIPAPITLPERTPDLSTFTYLFRVGKAYLLFFKSGMSSIFTNYKLTRPIQSLADTKGSGTLTALAHANPPLITRGEFQYLLRARHDIVRLPVFGIIFLLFGEMSPLILPFVSPLVPHPCRIPAQLARQRRKAAERRHEAFRKLLPPPVVEDAAVRGLEELSGREVAHVAEVLGVWRAGVARRVEYLELDSLLLRRGGGVDAIHSGEELMMAAEDRGISVYGKSEHVVREEVRNWERLVEKVGGVQAGMWLVRSEAWGRACEELEEKE